MIQIDTVFHQHWEPKARIVSQAMIELCERPLARCRVMDEVVVEDVVDLPVVVEEEEDLPTITDLEAQQPRRHLK